VDGPAGRTGQNQEREEGKEISLFFQSDFTIPFLKDFEFFSFSVKTTHHKSNYAAP
jgi:hypothetical protein